MESRKKGCEEIFYAKCDTAEYIIKKIIPEKRIKDFSFWEESGYIKTACQLALEAFHCFEDCPLDNSIESLYLYCTLRLIRAEIPIGIDFQHELMEIDNAIKQIEETGYVDGIIEEL